MEPKLIILFLASLVLSDVHSVTVMKSHDSITIKEGDPYELLCTADTDVKACTIQTPYGATYVMWVGSAYENGRVKPNDDTKRNDRCGVKIDSAKDTDNGKWECIISAQTQTEGSLSVKGIVDVTVAVAPKKVQLKIGENLSPSEYKVKMDAKVKPEVKIDCVAEQARPQPEFIWYLGNEELKAGKSKREENKKEGKADYIETLKYFPDSKHNGKTLRCQVSHQAYTQVQKEEKKNEAELLLKISYPPVPSKKPRIFYGLTLGTTNEVRMEFNANPKPSEGYWTVNRTVVQLGSASLDKKYSSASLEKKDGIDGQWVALLTIHKLQVEDTKGKNTLTLKNEEGETVYEFQLALGKQPDPAPSGSEPPKSLTVGIIVIIVIIVLILVIVIVARAKGILCFAAKGGDELDEEKEAFENVEKGESNAIVQDSKQVAGGDSNSNKGTPDKKLDQDDTAEAKAEKEEKKSNGAHTPV